MTRVQAEAAITHALSQAGGPAAVRLTARRCAATRFAQGAVSQSMDVSDAQLQLTLTDQNGGEETITTNMFPHGGGVTVAESPLAAAFDARGRAETLARLLSATPGNAAGSLSYEWRAEAHGNSLSRGIVYAQRDYVQGNVVATHKGASGSGEWIFNRVADAPEITAAFAQAAERALRGAAPPVSLPGGSMTVVLAPVAVADLLWFVTRGLNTQGPRKGDAYVTRAIAAEREAMLNKGFPLHIAPEDPRLFPWPFASRGETVRHVRLSPGSRTLEDLIAATKHGLFVSEWHYTNLVDAHRLQVTGLTRNGTFLIEDGRLTQPVATLRFTEVLASALGRAAFASGLHKVDAGGWPWLVPGARIEGFQFNSVG